MAAKNRLICNRSRARVCTVCTALRVSPAMPLVSAMRSWVVRESRRTRRPNTNSGTNTRGISKTITPVRVGLVSVSMTNAPAAVTALRNVIDRFTPAIDWTRVVSVVNRESTSPERILSKKLGSRFITCAYKRFRKSATTRSPSHDTRYDRAAANTPRIPASTKSTMK